MVSRYKGVLWTPHAERYVFQGVHMVFTGQDLPSPLPPPRVCVLLRPCLRSPSCLKYRHEGEGDFERFRKYTGQARALLFVGTQRMS